MGDAQQIHPLKAWRTAVGRAFSARDVSALISARGKKFGARSVVAVEDGWRRPGYDICEAIEEITGGMVTIAQLRHWPVRQAKKTA